MKIKIKKTGEIYSLYEFQRKVDEFDAYGRPNYNITDIEFIPENGIDVDWNTRCYETAQKLLLAAFRDGHYKMYEYTKAVDVAVGAAKRLINELNTD